MVQIKATPSAGKIMLTVLLMNEWHHNYSFPAKGIRKHTENF
jgi:hypothetical protein